jgi:hypothetical protein
MQKWLAGPANEGAVEIGAEELDWHGRSWKDVDLTIDSIRRRSKSKGTKMKSAYELAMERLEKSAPSMALTDEQKRELADVDSTYKAKTAEKELLLRGEMEKAQAAGNFEEMEKLEKQLANEIRRLREDCEAKKEKLRASFAR